MIPIIFFVAILASLGVALVALFRRGDHGGTLLKALTIRVGLSVAFGINGEVHWASDAVAGLLMGGAIGWTIGRAYRDAEAAASLESPLSFRF